MRRIALHFRQMLCDHQFESEMALAFQMTKNGKTTNGARVSQTCVHCGHHRSYWEWRD